MPIKKKLEGYLTKREDPWTPEHAMDHGINELEAVELRIEGVSSHITKDFLER